MQKKSKFIHTVVDQMNLIKIEIVCRRNVYIVSCYRTVAIKENYPETKQVKSPIRLQFSSQKILVPSRLYLTI